MSLWWAALALLPVLLASVPVDLEVSLTKARTAGWRKQIRLAWMFGLLGIRFSGRREGREESRPAKEGQRTGRHAGSARRLKALMASRGFLRRSARLLAHLRQSARVRRLQLDLRFGCGDPAETGRLSGLFHAVLGILPVRWRWNVNLEPEFSGECLEGACQAEVRFYPLRAIAAVLAFAVSPIAWRAVFAAALARRRA